MHQQSSRPLSARTTLYVSFYLLYLLCTNNPHVPSRYYMRCISISTIIVPFLYILVEFEIRFWFCIYFYVCTNNPHVPYLRVQLCMSHFTYFTYYAPTILTSPICAYNFVCLILLALLTMHQQSSSPLPARTTLYVSFYFSLFVYAPTICTNIMRLSPY